MSKFILFEWRCTQDECRHKFDEMAKQEVKELPCPICESPAKRLISTGRGGFSNGRDPSMPTDYDRWERMNRQKTKQDKKFYEDHGVDKKHHSYGS